jgi:hypothetical protein
MKAVLEGQGVDLDDATLTHKWVGLVPCMAAHLAAAPHRLLQGMLPAYTFRPAFRCGLHVHAALVLLAHSYIRHPVSRRAAERSVPSYLPCMPRGGRSALPNKGPA